MATPPVEWHDDAFEDLAAHDAWRVENKWDPMALEIYDAVSATFARGFVFPKKQCRLRGEPIPVFKTFVEVRSKKFIVYFLDPTPPKIRRVLHPGQEDTGRVEE